MNDWTPVPILMYHAIEDATHPRQYKHLYVTATEFAWQMRSLKAKGYQPITFASLRQAMANKGVLPPKPVILTFDDGYDNMYRNAFPILNALRFPCTVFLVSSLIGRSNEWVIREGLDAFPLLGWDRIAEMQASELISFQPHTVTHAHLTQISTADATREMAASRDTLEQKLGAAMDVFCYPYGDFNDTVARIAEDVGYLSAVTTQFGRVRQGDDPLRLPRISIYHIPPFSLDYGPAGLNYWWRLRTRKDARPVPTLRAPSGASTPS